MNGIIKKRRDVLIIIATPILLWLAQPPFKLWPIAAIALVPWLIWLGQHRATRRELWLVWIASTTFWLVSLQGLRHAHPAMFLCWMALSGYLGVYGVAFVLSTRRWLERGIPLVIAAPVMWVGLECVRNYLLTGISAAMLGHTLADVPHLIQIADLGGTYVVSGLLVWVNVAIVDWLLAYQDRTVRENAYASSATAGLALAATLAYGSFRLGETLAPGETTYMLVGRDEPVEYEQDARRELEVFDLYARQSIQGASAAGKAIDVVVWPESMFTGSLPWLIADKNLVVPDGMGMSTEEFRGLVDENRNQFVSRASYVQSSIARAASQSESPHLVVGCGVVRYSDVPLVYSSVVHITRDGTVQDWYGKNHLVMFGEYIPLIQWIPGLKSLVPPGLGVQPGRGAVAFDLDGSSAAANICIETAVERIAVGHIGDLLRSEQSPKTIVTVTNDGWFDRSSVVSHHLRCAQLVAVGCRRPILSAANGGPTAWIDSAGRIVEKLPFDVNGTVIATPETDSRVSLYVRIGDWPARALALAATLTLLFPIVRRFAYRFRGRGSPGGVGLADDASERGGRGVDETY